VRKKKSIKLLVSLLSFLLIFSSGISNIAIAAGKSQKATSYTSKENKKLKTANLQKDIKSKALQKRSITATKPSSASTKEINKVRKSKVKSAKKATSKQNVTKKALPKTSSQKTKSTFSKKVNEKYKADELIIKFKNNTSANSVRSKHSLKTKKKLNSIGAEVLKVKQGTNIENLVKTLKTDSSVVYVQPNYRYMPSDMPNDPKFDQLWGLHNTGQAINGYSGTDDMDIDYPEAMQEFTNQNIQGQVVIGVIDTGVDINHPDLKDHIWTNTNEIPDNGIDDDRNGYIDDVHGWDFYNFDNTVFDPKDGDEHGTHVSGTIAASANNEIGVTGIAPNVKIMPLKFIGPDGGLTSDAISAIEYASRMGVKITNNSWGSSEYDQALKDAIESSNSLFVAAAGNDSYNIDNDAEYPAGFDSENILSVAAIDNNGYLANFSNYGYENVDIAAPGVNILSTVPKKIERGAAAQINNTTYNYKAIFNGFGFENIIGDDRQAAFNKAKDNLGLTSTSNILLVQDDQSDSYSYSYLNIYKALLDNAGLNYSIQTVPTDQNGPNIETLNNYDAVIWFSGDAMGTESTTTLTEQDLSNLDQYLHQGDKSLILTGQELFFQNEDSSFVTDTLSLSLVGETEGTEYIYVKGAPNTIYDGSIYQMMYVPTWADYIESKDESIATVNLVYPGDENYDEAYAYFDGTSMATAYVTGVAALLAGKLQDSDPATLKNIIMTSGDDLESLTYNVRSGKKLNAYNALTFDPSSLDNDVPGTPLNSESVDGTLDAANDTDDVYAVQLDAGETIKATLTGETGTDFDLYLFDQYANTVNNSGDMLAYSENANSSDESFEFTVRESGTYYIDVYAYAGSGGYTLNISAGNGVGEYEDNSPAINYYGYWDSLSNTAYSYGTIQQTNSYGWMEFSFVGNVIEWIGSKDKNQGKADIYIDGKYMDTVTLYADSLTAQQSIYKKTVSYGKHLFEIDWTGQHDPRARKSGTAINIDKLVVSEDLTPPEAPTGVQVTYDDYHSSPAVKWDYNEFDHNVYRKEKGTDTYTLLNNTPVTGDNYYYDHTAVPGKTYDYVVTALGYKNVQSEQSAPATYIFDDIIPGVPMTSSSVTGDIGTYGDSIDVWSVQLEAGKTYSFSFNGPKGTDFDYRLYDSSETDIYSDSTLRGGYDIGSEEYFTYPVDKTGTYYIVVYAFNGAGQYSITLDSKPTVQDDDIPVAVPLNNATSVSDFLDWDDIDDVYSVDLAKGDTITLNLSSKATNGNDFDLYLYGPNSPTVDYWADNYVDEVAGSNAYDTSNETITYTADVAGTYYIDVNNGYRSGPYNLNVEYKRASQSTTKIVEENDPQVTYSGSWTTSTSSVHSGGTAKVNSTAGSYAQLTFNGTGIKVLSYTSSNRGKADIYIDGTLSQTVDLYSSTVKYQTPIFEVNNLTNGAHTIKIVNTGQKSSASSGIYIALDAFVVETPPQTTTQVIEDSDSQITYYGTWTTSTSSVHSGGTAKVNNTAGSYAQLTFNGTGIKVLAYTAPNRGKADIYIDGVLSDTVDLYSSSTKYQASIFEENNLVNGPHTIKIVNRGEKSSVSSGLYISLDAFIITM
jgi:subtilisin family serine protease